MSLIPPPSHGDEGKWAPPSPKIRPPLTPVKEALAKMGADFNAWSPRAPRNWKAIEAPQDVRELLVALSQDHAETIAKALKAKALDLTHSPFQNAGHDPTATQALWELCQWADPQQAASLFVSVMGQSFGNKAANLMLLDLQLKEIPGAQAPRVPEFFSVSHREVAAFLDDHIPGWRSLDPTACSEQIRAVFEQFPNEAIDRLGLNQLLEKWQQNNWIAMVRSTGREDSAETANAGGNESVANVACQRPAIAAAMGRVIASYFSSRSLSQQRMLLGEVEQEAFVPVLIQRMIREPAHAQPHQIPVSGVLFSQEVQGPTPEAVMVQATYGHGEGVVAGEVPCDSYYLLHGEHYSAIRGKSYRVAPAGDEGTEFQENAPALWDRPCLSPELLMQLEDIGRHLQEVYHGPIDIEFVVEQGQLYVVQVRPIVSRAPETATFVDISKAKKAGLQRMKMEECIVSAGQKVVRIDDPSELVVAKTLDGALREALKRRDQGLITKAVITQESAGVLSHWATSFREMGIPVLVGPDPKAHIKPGMTLLVDPQRTSLWIGTGSTEGVIREGTIRHPVPSVLSDMQPSEDPSSNIGGALGAQRDSFLDLGTTWDLESLLDAIGDTTQPERLKEAYAVLSGRLQRHAGRLKSSGTPQKTQDAFLSLCRRIEYLGWRALTYLQGADRNIGRVVPLMASWVAALLTQKGTETIGGSIAQILRNEKLPPVIADEGMRIGLEKIWTKAGAADRLDEMSRAVMALKSVVIDPDLQESWQEITCELLRRGPKYANGVLECVQALQKLHLLVPMLNGPISKAMRLRPVREAVQALLEQVAEAIPHLNQMVQSTRDLRLRMQATQQSLPSWTELEGFDQRWEQFQKQILEPAHALLPALLSDNELERIQAGHLLASITDLTDSVIKTVKGHDALPVEERFRRVRLMVEELQRLSVAATKRVMELPKEKTLPVGREFWVPHPYCQDGYLTVWEAAASRLNNSMDHLAEEKNSGLTPNYGSYLEPSAFNVSSALFTAGTNPSREIGGSVGRAPALETPEVLPAVLVTLEDAFTLAHQNLLAACRLVDRWTIDSMQALPFESQFFLYKFPRGRLSGVNCAADEVSVDLSVPLRNHAAHLCVKQAKEGTGLSVELSLYGHNLTQRWQRLRRLVERTYPGTGAVLRGPSTLPGMETNRDALRAPHALRLTISLSATSMKDIGNLAESLNNILSWTSGYAQDLPRLLPYRPTETQMSRDVLRAMQRKVLVSATSTACSPQALRSCYGGHEGELSAAEHRNLLNLALSTTWKDALGSSLDRLWADSTWLASVGRQNPHMAFLGGAIGHLLNRSLRLELTSQEIDQRLQQLQSLVPSLEQVIRQGTADQGMDKYSQLVPLLQNDPTLARAAIERDVRSIRYLNPENSQFLLLVKEAIQLDRKALGSVERCPAVDNDPEIIEALQQELKRSSATSTSIPNNFLSHPHVVIHALEHGYWWVLKDLPQDIWKDPAIQQAIEAAIPSVVKALTNRWIELRDLPEAIRYLPATRELRRELVLAAVRANPAAANYLDASYAHDQEILTLIEPQIARWIGYIKIHGQRGLGSSVSSNTSPLQNLPPLALAIPAVVIAGIKKTDIQQLEALYRLLNPELRLQEEIALELVSKDGAALSYIERPVRDHRSVQLAAARQTWGALKFMAPEVRAAPDIVEAAVPSALQTVTNPPRSPPGRSPAFFKAMPTALLYQPAILDRVSQSDLWALFKLGSNELANQKASRDRILECAAEAIVQDPAHWPDQQLSKAEAEFKPLWGGSLPKSDDVSRIQHPAKRCYDTMRSMIIEAAHLAKQRDPSIEDRLPAWLRS
ncbi:MAG: PEP/pyruvate-binding domain-containing protein [Chlamydiia bacterium]